MIFPIKKTFLLFLIVFCHATAFTQQKIEKIDRLFDKFNSFIYKNADSAYYYCKQAEDLNNKIGNDYYGSKCLFFYALYYYNVDDNLKSRTYNDKAFILAKNTQNTETLFRIYNLNGAIFLEGNEYDKAFLEFQKALYYLKKSPNNKYYGILHLNLGNLFTAKGDTISGIKNYQLTAKYSILAKDTARLLTSYMLMANAIKNRDHKKAHGYYEKAFYLAKLTKDRQEQFNIRFNQSSNFLGAKDARALLYLKKAEELLGKLDNKSLLFHIYFNYGAYYTNQKNYKEAINYYEIARDMYDKQKIPINQKLDLMKNLIWNYEKDGNFQKSYDYQSQFYKLKDSLFTIEKEKNYNHMLARYEVEKKNSQIQLLNKENELQKVRRTRVYFIFGTIILFLVLGFFFYKNKLKAEQELNRTKDILEGQNKERNRLAKELHDGIAGSLAWINILLGKENDILQNHNISSIQDHIIGLHGEVREISHNLSSNFLVEKTFYQLMQYLAKQNMENRIQTDILFFPEDALGNIHEGLKMQLYRIVQELFANIRKHAHADRVQVNVTQNDNFICLMIEDNGKGFLENNADGIGLKNIRERLGNFDANMEIDSTINSGSTITITFKI